MFIAFYTLIAIVITLLDDISPTPIHSPNVIHDDTRAVQYLQAAGQCLQLPAQRRRVRGQMLSER